MDRAALSTASNSKKPETFVLSFLSIFPTALYNSVRRVSARRDTSFVNFRCSEVDFENWIDVSVLDSTKKGGYCLKGIRTCDPCGGTSSPNVLSYTRCLKVWPGEPGAPQTYKPCELYP